MESHRLDRWQALVGQIATEFEALPAGEKSWISRRLQRINSLQQRLEQLFLAGNGPRGCAQCLGDCCAKGHNHMTLANLLSFIRRGETPPVPDFSRTCPFLSEYGCTLAVADRPYNCVSFVCDIIENSLTSEEVQEFYSVEQLLRQVYLEFASRYAGGSLTGLLLQYDRLEGRPFLGRKSAKVDAKCSTKGACNED